MKKNISLLWLLLVAQAQARGIDALWHDMQKKYKSVCKYLHSSGLEKREQSYCHDIWKTTKQQVRDIILGQPDRYFAHQSCIVSTMVRQGMSIVQSYETLFLQDCISQKTKEKLGQFHESDFLGLDRNCKEFNCSTNSLGHLFYAAKVLEAMPDDSIQSIVEVGSGYGNLASIFKQLIPSATLYLIDLPELLSLQYLFLKATMPDVEVVFHDRIPSVFKKGAIHLIPVFMVPEIGFNADLFISTFALSESSRQTQQVIIDKQFFNARLCYITGQLHGWGDRFKFAGHHLVIEAIRNQYPSVSCQPHHVSLHVMPSYEIMARA